MAICSEAKLFHVTNNGTLCDWSTKSIEDDDYDDCTPGNYYRDQVCHNYNSFQKAANNEEMERKCVSRWLVIPQTYIIGLVWAGTFLVLILLFFVNPSKKKCFQTTVRTLNQFFCILLNAYIFYI